MLACAGARLRVCLQVEPQPNEVMRSLLDKMRLLLDPDREPPSDADLNIIPSLLHHIRLIDETFGAPCYETITEVRIAFYNVLLAKRSFSLTLVLIQDINNLCSQSFARSDQHADLSPYLDWMSSERVLQQLLGVNMHQRQYVDALQRLLENMARLHALDTQTTLKLVESMLQVSCPAAACLDVRRHHACIWVPCRLLSKFLCVLLLHAACQELPAVHTVTEPKT